ncbi:MAG: hypothetical protein P9M12_03945, partial [Candidatus Aceula lacicola]|nr:hypothetical protein [Candidatus Aceula lacicola]
IKGVDTKDISQDIYKQYIDSFKKGVCDFIKVEYDQYARKNIPRKYFSGGVEWELDGVFNQTSSQRAGSALFNSMEKAEKIVVVTAETKEIASKATVSVIPKKSGSPLTSSLEVYKNLKNTLDGKEIFTGGESYFLYFDIDESLKRGSDLIVDTDIYLIDEKGAKTKSSVCSFSIYDEKEIGFFEFRLDFVNFVPADQKISNLAAEGQVEKILDAITAQNDRELFSGESLGGGFIEQQIMRYLVSVLPNDAKILGYLEHFQVLEAGSDTAIFRDPKSGFLKKKKAGEKGYYFIIGAGEKYLSPIEYMEKNDEVVNASELASLVVLKNADVGSREMDINLSWMVDVLERVEEPQTIKGFKAVEGLVDYQEKFLEHQRESDFKKLLSSSDDLEEEDALGFYRKNKNGEIFSESLGFEIIVKKSQSEELKISSALLKKSSKKRWKEIIEDLLSEARKGKVKLVLVDLDNTLMKPKGYIGSEAQKIDSIKKNAFNFAVEMIEGSEDLSGEVIDSIIGEAVRRAQDFVYAQGDKDERRMIKYKVLKIPGLLTPAHLKELMDLGVPVDGSSARPGDEEKVEITLGMLESLGIVMGVNLNNVDFTSGDGRIKALRVQQYIQNFISKQKEIGNIVKAEEIYFIDDLKKNIDSIEGLQTGVKLIQLLSEKNNNHQSDRWGDFYRFARQAAKDGKEDVIEFLLNAYDLAPMHKEQKVVDLAKSILNSIQYSEFEEEIKAKEIRNPFKLNTSIVWMQGVSDEEIERKINEQLSHPQSFGKKKAKAEKRLDWREYSGISSSIMAERDDVLGEEFKKVISSNIFSYDLSGLSVQEVLSDLLQEGVVEVESDDGVAFEFRLYEFSDTWYSIEVNNSDRENIGYFDFRLGSAEYGYEREGERSVALLSEAVHHKGIGRALVSLGLELSKLNGKKLFYLKNVKDLKFFKGYGFKDSFSGKNDLTFNL